MHPSSNTPPLPSNRSFGMLFAAVFAIAGAVSLWRGGALYPWLFGLSALTLAVTLVVPEALAPFNRLWMRFGELLHRLVSPVMVGAIFYGVIMPFALVMRLAKRDALRLKFDPAAKSYWIAREPPGPDAESFNNQF